MKKTRKIKRRQKVRNILLNIFLLLTISSLIFLIIFKSDFFKINNIQVLGNLELDKEDIVKYSQIYIGENIFRINRKNIEENLKKLPYVKEVKIRRILPQDILIDLVEREEKVLVKLISSYQVIDLEGYILKEVDKPDNKLPIILGLNIHGLGRGDNLFNSIDNEELIVFLEEADRLDLLSQIESIDLKSLNNIDILLKSGIDITFGKLDNVEYRLRLLDEVLKDIKEREVKVEKIIMDRGEHPIIITED